MEHTHCNLVLNLYDKIGFNQLALCPEEEKLFNRYKEASFDINNKIR